MIFRFCITSRLGGGMEKCTFERIFTLVFFLLEFSTDFSQTLVWKWRSGTWVPGGSVVDFFQIFRTLTMTLKWAFKTLRELVGLHFRARNCKKISPFIRNILHLPHIFQIFRNNGPLYSLEKSLFSFIKYQIIDWIFLIFEDCWRGHYSKKFI